MKAGASLVFASTGMCGSRPSLSCFFFNDPATTEIYTLSLHDALPISYEVCATDLVAGRVELARAAGIHAWPLEQVDSSGRVLELTNGRGLEDRESTRLNSSHSQISYAVFCLQSTETGL